MEIVFIDNDEEENYVAVTAHITNDNKNIPNKFHWADLNQWREETELVDSLAKPSGEKAAART